SNGILSTCSPDIQHDRAEQTHEVRSRAERLQKLKKLRFEFFCSNAYAFAATAVVVPIILLPAFRCASRQGRIARIASHEPPQRKIRMVQCVCWTRVPACEDGLRLIKQCSP